jgi:hypothetical protein
MRVTAMCLAVSRQILESNEMGLIRRARVLFRGINQDRVGLGRQRTSQETYDALVIIEVRGRRAARLDRRWHERESQAAS